jgi:predicted Zn-dependent protease
MMRGRTVASPGDSASKESMLREFIANTPNDPFPRYGLAIELKSSGRPEEAAEAFRELLARFPDYTPAYLHAGNTLVVLGRRDDAKAVYRAGIEACTRKRDDHAKGEIQSALADLELTTEETR